MFLCRNMEKYHKIILVTPFDLEHCFVHINCTNSGVGLWVLSLLLLQPFHYNICTTTNMAQASLTFYINTEHLPV